MLLGAGASVRAGFPITSELSEVLRQKAKTLDSTASLPAGVSAIATLTELSKRLRETAPDLNFEVWLAALDALAELEVNFMDDGLQAIPWLRFAPDISEMLAAVLGRKTLPKPLDAYSAEFVGKFLRENIARHFMQIERSIAPVVRDEYRECMTPLAGHAALRVFNLNYDNVIRGCGVDFKDGFGREVEAGCQAFDPAEFQRILAVAQPCLCHLHGSINFGYHAPESEHDSIGADPIFRYDDPERALHSYSLGKWEMAATRVRAPGPLIAGFAKTAQINFLPYGQYFSSFVERLIACPRLVIAGYSFGDVHINYWLRQHAAIHRDRRRYVVVTKGIEFSLTAKYVLKRLGELWPEFIVSGGVSVATPVPHAFVHGRIMYFTNGFPWSPEFGALIADHLGLSEQRRQ